MKNNKKEIDISPIYLRNTPPPMETFNHPEFLEMFFKWLKPERYLELGVRDGACWNRVSPLCKHAVAVDIIPCRIHMSDNMDYYQKTTDAYFEEEGADDIFDAIFIDADHSHEQSLKDFMNAKDRIVEDGFIFLHDTYPYDKSMHGAGWSHDVYKTALHIKENFYSDFEHITLPFNPGFTILKKMPNNKQLLYM